MANGITFRGKHSDEFFIAVKTVGRPILPPPKQLDEEIAYKDGTADYSEAGGRIYYEDKVLTLEFNIIEFNMTKLNIKVSRIARWLAGGYGELIFDDAPFVKWIAKPVDLDDVTFNLKKNGRTKIQFRCRPFNKWIYDSEGVPIGSDYPIGSDLPIGLGNENEITFGAGSSEHILNYAGDAPVRPIANITLDAGVRTFSLTVNGVTVKRTSGNGVKFAVDCENAVMPNGLSGDFFELLPNENTIRTEASGGGGNIKFEYRHNFLYGDGF